MVIAELLVLAEDAVKELIVGRVAEERVLEERKGGAVGRGEVVAHEVITAGEHRFEVVKRAGHPAREVSDARMGWVGLGELRLNLVGGPFQTRLNQSMKMSISARRASSAGYSGATG